MALDLNCNDQPYIVGRITAIVEFLVKTPPAFASKVASNPRDQCFSYHIAKCMKETDGLINLVGRMGSLSDYKDPKGQFWMGYYHQKAFSTRNSIGLMICERRRELGMTQKQLAEKCLLTESTVSKIESGRWSASVDILSKIASALDMELTIVEKHQ